MTPPRCSQRLSKRAAQLILGAVASAISVFSPSPSAAEPSRFRPVPGSTLDARALFDPLTLSALRYGNPLKLVPKPGAQAQFEKGFQVRIFRVADGGQLPNEITTFDPCIVFEGNVYVVRGGRNLEEVSLGETKSLSWLTLRDGARPTNGRYLIAAEVADPRSDNFLRLERSAIKGYFSKAIYFEVAAPATFNADAVAAELNAARKRSNEAREAAKVNDPKFDCIRTADGLGVESVACSEDAESNSAEAAG